MDDFVPYSTNDDRRTCTGILSIRVLVAAATFRGDGGGGGGGGGGDGDGVGVVDGGASNMYAAPEFAALVPGLSLLEGGALFGVVSMPVAFSITLICLYSSEFGSSPSSIDAPAADPSPPYAPAAIVRPSPEIDTEEPK